MYNMILQYVINIWWKFILNYLSKYIAKWHKYLLLSNINIILCYNIYSLFVLMFKHKTWRLRMIIYKKKQSTIFRFGFYRKNIHEKKSKLVLPAYKHLFCLWYFCFSSYLGHSISYSSFVPKRNVFAHQRLPTLLRKI